ncbi:hypothetical protein KPH14_009558 [Odynerus spinipes]|uniref:Invertebrate defensins family profile domain-containing protein n=1 Tax=Odynerus spinipes TaxID=1348599 RepID=A0AAD9RPM3_9HYME|nr:hypothetical protein KPH14_009558 [Odynerus spinipes]
MAKIYCVLAIIFFVAVTANQAVPIEDTEFSEMEDSLSYVDELNEFIADERADRQRRVTCDLLSFGGKIGSSACAANCLSMGKAGGYCNGGVCVCRKDSFIDLWRKRFG